MELAEQFIGDLRARRRSHRTLETYKSNVYEFLKHYPEPERVDKHDLFL